MNLYNIKSITINNKKINDIDTNGDNNNQTLATTKTLTDYSKYKGLYYIKNNHLYIRTDDDNDYYTELLPNCVLNSSTSSGATMVKNLTLPGLNDVEYQIQINSDNTEMTNLKSITMLSGENNGLIVHLSKAPSLRYFNLMEGLTNFSLYGTKILNEPSNPNEFIKLVLPSSLTVCCLQNLYLSELVFRNDYDTTKLKLQLSNVWIREKLECMRDVDYISSSLPVIDTNYIH